MLKHEKLPSRNSTKFGAQQFMEKGKTIGGNNFHLNFFKNICCIKILNTICEKMKKKIVTSEKKEHHKIFKKILHALKRDAHFNHNRLIVFV